MVKTILIVDDELPFRQALSESLSNDGYQTLSAANVNEAFKFLQQKKVDLILLDILMPKIDGINFIKKVRASEFKNTPIIVLTNLSEVTPSEAVKEILVKANTSLKTISQKIKQYI